MRTINALTPIDAAARRAARNQLGDRRAHEALLAATPALHEVEVGGRPGVVPPPTGGLCVAAWNVERGTHVDAIADALSGAAPDVALLTELDHGMARSGNRHTTSDIAGALGHRYAYGVEYVELGLGDAHEAAALDPGAVNTDGFHGNAIVTRGSIDDVSLVRIESHGAWFDDARGQPRIGGRMALIARVELDGGSLVCCSVHLESESDPEERRSQLATVLRAIDERYGTGPAIVGGDLNTFSTDLDALRADGGHARLNAVDSTRWCWPVPYEPLFDVAAMHGFSADGLNRADSTMRLAADQPPNSLLRLDWLLARGLTAVKCATVPAVGRAGQVLSDHDLITATVAFGGD